MCKKDTLTCSYTCPEGTFKFDRHGVTVAVTPAVSRPARIMMMTLFVELELEVCQLQVCGCFGSSSQVELGLTKSWFKY